MRLRHSSRSCLLLAVFLVGSLGAPLLHHMQHALVRAHQQEADERRAEAVRLLDLATTDAGLLDVEVPAFHDLVCHDCFRHIAGTVLEASAPAAYFHVEEAQAPSDLWTAGPSQTYRPIRAPPLTA